MNLTDLSYYLRKYAPYAIIALIGLLIFYYSIQLLLIYFHNCCKVKPIYINPVFGKIKKPQIKDFIKDDFTYIIDTVEGTPITATVSAKVISLPPTNSRFGYREKIYFMAKTLGFDVDKVKYELDADNKAVFKDGDQELSIDITNFNFNYSFNYDNKPEVFDKAIIPPEKEIENKAINTLIKIDRYPEELSKGKIIINYYLYDPLSRKSDPTTSDKANVVEVNFERSNIDNLQIVSPQYFKSQNSIFLVFYEDHYQILKAEVNFFEQSSAEFGVYPIKSGEQAWQKLASGEAMIVSASKEKKNIIIKKMFLAYLDPDFYQLYLQPVYVFLGDNKFVAYVPAVTDEYLGE